jgi:hypothetical protein
MGTGEILYSSTIWVWVWYCSTLPIRYPLPSLLDVQYPLLPGFTLTIKCGLHLRYSMLFCSIFLWWWRHLHLNGGACLHLSCYHLQSIHVSAQVEAAFRLCLCGSMSSSERLRGWARVRRQSIETVWWFVWWKTWSMCSSLLTMF